jgi:DNA repair protein RadD
MQLYDYQAKLKGGVYASWGAGHRHVMGVLPTGGGKTRLIASIVADHANMHSMVGAHRQELVHQIAMALAEAGVHHRIIAPTKLTSFISKCQQEELGRSYVHGQALAAVSSVDTLISRAETLKLWARQVKLVQGDEAHHWLMGNKWGTAYTMFENARGALWTATPRRSDRKSLREGDGGICTDIVLGPTMRELMQWGYLSLYTVFGPPPSIDRSKLTVGSTGDYTQNSVQTESNRSQIVGDLHDHYFKLTPGKMALGFMVDVKQAFELAERFRASGLPAVAMSGDHTSPDERVENMRAFKRGDLKAVINCDLFGEGTDVPGVEVILDGAPTLSTPRFMQRLGRLLRRAPGKVRGWYIDAAGNYLSFVERHGCLPEDVNDWSLDVPPRRKRLPNDEAALTACPQCYLLRERYKPVCPYCGFRPVAKGRSLPEQVDGDLHEYDDALLKLLTRKADEIMLPPPVDAAPYIRENWAKRTDAQHDLRWVMALWGGKHAQGVELSEAWRLFYHRFGVDVATAKTWGGPEARALTERIWSDVHQV